MCIGNITVQRYMLWYPAPHEYVAGVNLCCVYTCISDNGTLYLNIIPFVLGLGIEQWISVGNIWSRIISNTRKRKQHFLPLFRSVLWIVFSSTNSFDTYSSMCMCIREVITSNQQLKVSKNTDGFSIPYVVGAECIDGFHGQVLQTCMIPFMLSARPN